MTTVDENTADATDQGALRVAICANFVAEPLEEPLRYWLREMGVLSSISFAPYNQVYQQLFDPSTLLSTNRNGLNIILVRLEEWHRNPVVDQIKETPLKARESALKRNVQDFLAGVMELRKRNSAPLIVVLCPNTPAISGIDPGNQHVSCNGRVGERRTFAGQFFGVGLQPHLELPLSRAGLP